MEGPARALLACAAMTLLPLGCVWSQTGQRDQFFSKVSFEQWRLEGKQSLLHTSFEIVPPELSAFQRIVVGVKVQIEGPELAEHHAVILVEFADDEGGVWQTHGPLGREAEYLQNAFVLPGDYSVSVAIFDPQTFRHSFDQKKLHVAPLKTEPLPGSWDNLPKVEFLPPGVELPDAWYLPSTTGRLKLPVQTARPVHIDVLVNTTPGDRKDSVGEFRRNMSAVVPALKVMSQIELSSGEMSIGLLDLVHRRAFAASSWSEMRPLLTQANPGIIDVGSLDSRWGMRSFLLDQIQDRVRGDSARVVIVLSGPAFLQDQEPAAHFELPSDPRHRVFYIRCRLIPRSVLAPRPRPRPGARPHPPLPGSFVLPLDDLQQPLESSDAMLFDVITPEQFRRVLASIIGQISRM